MKREKTEDVSGRTSMEDVEHWMKHLNKNLWTLSCRFRGTTDVT